ncbi:N-acetylglucosaminyl-diphospho-decaprenol L-rhamnosyltransferase [compost metagenome]
MAITDLGVVIVTWNSATTIDQCLSLLPEGLRVVVVDNGSSDDTRERVSRRGADLLTPGRNLGFGAACNLGAAHLGTGDILLLNPDAAITAENLAIMKAALLEDPTVGIVGPLIRDAEGGMELSWGEDPTLMTEWRRKRAHAKPEEGTDTLGAVDWVTGGCCLIRRDVWEMIGGFDERYFLYFEDLDLCRRIRQAGYAVRFEPRAEALHSRGVSSKQIGTLVERYYRSSQIRYYGHYLPLTQQWALRGYLLAKYGLRFWKSSHYRQIVAMALRGRPSTRIG